jgi:hypothetical protein
MQKTVKLVIDTFSEIHNLLRPYQDADFYNFAEHTVIPNAVYVIGREQARLHSAEIQKLVKEKTIYLIYSNPTEGSEPMEWNLRKAGYIDLLQEKKMSVITGGDINPDYPQLHYENFLCQMLDYDENIQAIANYQNWAQLERPYKFLFLNGRMREHRKYLLFRFNKNQLLKQCLWSNLDPTIGIWPQSSNDYLKVNKNSVDSLRDQTFPIQYLPVTYEVDRYCDQVNSLPASITSHGLEAKLHLFNNEWGEIYLSAKPYADTYFSLVTETVFAHPFSFRTEKICKPIAIGHPFIAVSNKGYYRDLHNIGFKTFGHVIDESFDQIDDNQQRIERVAEVVEDLCRQDLDSFLKECYTVCKYNQQHLKEMRLRVRQEFPDRFFQFLREQNIE